MITQQASATIHVMIRIWQEDGRIKYEEEFRDVLYAEPELILELPLGKRPTIDWVFEILGEIDLHEFILPDRFELCEEPVLYEAIGKFYIEGGEDYWEEYYEYYNFELTRWSCELEGEDT